jgi:8-amino-7-oxononanoate synthase
MKPRALPRLALADRTPLALLLNERQDDEDFTRARRFGRFLEPFHLKYSVTNEVQGRHCLVNGRRVVHFGSENYLGLEQHPEVVYAAKRAIDELGTDSGCPRLVSTQSNIVELEAALAQLLGAEAALLGNCAYQIHAETLGALFGDEDSVLFLDRNANLDLVRAAEAASARGARVVRVDVSNPPALRRVLKGAAKGALLLDGVSPIHGHCADLPLLDDLCREAGLVLYVDDSHGVGVLGPNGGGACEAAGLGYENLVVVGSLQKAFGAYGAFLAGGRELAELLRLTSRSYAATGTLQPAAVEAALASVRIARTLEGRQLRAQLLDRSRRVRAQLRALGYVVPEGDTPILPVSVGRDLKTLMAGRKLYDLGVFVPAVLHPDLPRGKGVLRVSLTTLHTEEDLAKLVAAFRDLRHYLPRHENPLRQAAHFVLEAGKARWLGSAYAGL